MKKAGIVLAALIVVIAAMVACGGKTGAGAGDDLSQRVELVMFIAGDEPPVLKEVEDNLNKLLVQKLNCTLKMNYISWADLWNVYPLMFSSGEVFDMAYSATWLSFADLARRGAFRNLDELWPKYAPKNYARQSKSALYQATVDGHLYCIPGLQAVNASLGLIYRADLALPYGWDGRMESFADFERYLSYVKANHPEIEPFAISDLLNAWLQDRSYYNLRGTPFYIDPSLPNPQIFYTYEAPNFSEYLDMIERWYNAGYWSRSALANTDGAYMGAVENGVSASRMHNIYSWDILYRNSPEWDVRWHNFVKDMSYFAYTQDAMVFANTSKNPERALMLWELITNDEEVFQAFYFGVEGKHFRIHTVGGQRYVEQLDPSYPFSNCWTAKTNEFMLPFYGAPDGYQSEVNSYDAYIKDDIRGQKFASFVFDTSSVEAEYAALGNVTAYATSLEYGFVDKTGLRELDNRMKAAGSDKVKAAAQEQLNAYIRDISR